MPAMLIGGAILAVVAALIFWPNGDEAPKTSAERAKDRTAAAAPGSAPSASVAAGGVQARAVDDPIRPPRQAKLNSAVLPEGLGPAPGLPEPEVIPDFDTVAEEIAYYEKKLDQAIEMRDQRALFVERLDRARERAEQSDNPQRDLEVFESRKKIVEDNLTSAQKKVEDLEAKLADLRR